MGDYKIWFEKGCEKWLEALPLGNGHLGAMVCGGKEGRYYLSETTCWSGSKQEKYLHNNASEFMEHARELLIKDNYEEAEQVLANCVGINENYGTQLPLGDLWVSINECPLNEKRELNLNTGIVKQELYFEDKVIMRESFISNPNKLMAIKVTSDKIIENICVKINGYNEEYNVKYENNEAWLDGKAVENMHSDGYSGVTYRGKVKVISDGKSYSSQEGITIESSSYVIVLLAVNTDMFITEQEEQLTSLINNAESEGYDELLRKHIEEHRYWMDKCSLSLGANNNVYEKDSTDKIIKEFKKSGINNVVAPLFFQYGRYLILSSSRPDSFLPAALQGIWNDNRACKMEWTDDMHLDINTQMNYFPAQRTGLGECCSPLHNWIINILAPEGEKIAKELYKKNGWVAHTVSNAFGWAAPGWGVSWGLSASCGGWIAAHLWEDYLYNNDKDILRKYFSTIKSCGEFLLELLIEDKDTGELLFTPSYSPENAFVYKGKSHNICTGSTFDTIVTKYIFNAIIEGSKILQIEDELISRVKDAIVKLPEFKVGKHGELLEWHKEFDEAMIDHRHTSHLLALYPFNIIDVEQNPELANAIRNSLNRRLGENAQDIIFANWAGALLVAYYAKLKDGELANDFLNKMMSQLSKANLMITHIGEDYSGIDGIYELDGNTGLTAGVVEMLLQYNKDEICIIPSIPKEWSNGEFKGIITEKGHIFSVKWQNNKVILIEIESKIDDSVTLSFNNIKKHINLKEKEKFTISLF